MGNTTTFTIKGILDIGDILNKVKTILNALSNVKLPDKLKSDFISGFDSLNKSLTELLSKAEKGINSKQEAKSINTTYDQVIRDFERVENVVLKIKAETNGAIDLSNFIKIDESAKNRIELLSSEIKDLKQQLEDLNVSKITEVLSALDQIKSKGARGKAELAVELFNTGQIQEAIKLLDLAISKLRALANNSAFGDLARNTADLNVEALNKMRQAMAEAAQEGEKLQLSISLKETERLNVATAEVERLKNGVVDASNSLHNLSTGVKENGDSFKEVTTNAGLFASELDQVKNRILYFFGLANAINLVKRAIRSAFNTVKELDKAMTETAVVTDYTIKDMWKLLPEYTKRANQLGVTTKEAYESATLYYQLGLNTDLAAALSTETLKMARIAGLDAAEATDRMTNALRGFNMELNATEALRVDDVYSQLAAMSASNVDEISTAMTKVASLAHNAGMEFETTSAFLALIIESTRESAETAGTALKTVVARFSEVKKLYSKEELKGTDEEGQVIDVNKISTALRTAGIDLNKYFLGEVGLDDIFMELASKWDSLTNIQLRYIATQAAGSRQQSRFIALMADYKRTQELVGAAYDSNGASEKQFEKTQDSMQSKLARLKNAWDEFAMGLANNAVLKGVVDALTTLLLIINKITSAFGEGAGSVLKWVTAIGALSGVKKLFASGGFIDKGLGTVLKGTQLGKSLFSKGTLSGLLFGGKTVPGSEAAKEATTGAGNGTTVQAGGGLFNSLFNKEAILKRREERANAFGAYTLAKQLTVGLTGQPDVNLQQDAFNNLSLLGKVGTKVSNSKLLGGVSLKLAGTKFAGGLSKLLGFGTSSGGVAAAAGLATALGAVAAAAAAAYAAYRLWERFSPEGQLKLATEFSKAMDLAAESAKKAKKETKEVYDTYIKKDKAVEEASTIAGRNQAILDRNNYVSDLLLKNESYAKYLKSEFKNGLLELTLDKDALKNITADAEKAANETDIGANLAKAMKAGKLAEVYRANISRAGVNLEEGTILDRDEEGAEVHRLMTKTELARYTNLENKALESDVVMKNFAKNAFSKMVDGEALGDELGGLVAGALAEGFDADKYYESVKSLEGGTWFNWMRSRKHWQEQYLKAYGVEADTNMKTADIARAVALKGALNLLEKNAGTFSNLVNSNKEAYLPLLNTINGVFGEDFTLDIDEEKFIADLEKGIGGEGKFKEFALLMGKTPEELKTILLNNIKALKEILTNNIKNLAIKGQKAGVSLKFFDKLSGLKAELIEDILGFSEIAEKSLGEGFSNFLDNLDTTLLGAYKEFFNNFDLDLPLLAVKKLNAAIADDTNPAIQSLAKEIKKTNLPLFDTGYLTQVFMTSEAYEGINENLEKFIKDNGEITAANIEELAESCSDLKTLLTETDVNALGLARAFTVVGKGEGSIEGITSAVLETLGATESADTAIDNLFKSIDEFSSGRDFGKAIDFANSKIEELRKSLENSDFGNETFKKNYEYFFNDYDKFMSLDWEGRQNYLFNRIEEVSELLSNDALGAMRKLAGIKGSGVTGEANGFDFSWDVQDWTWDEAVGKISEYLDVNELVASTILAAAAKHIPGLTELLDLNGFEKDITLFNLKISKEAVVTEQELEILAKAYGKEVDELWADLLKNAEKNGIELPARVKWQDDDGNPLTGEKLLEKARLTYNTTKFKIDAIRSRQVYDETIGGFDPTKLTTAILNSLKVNAALAREIANDYVKSVNGLFELPVLIPYKIVNEDGSETWDLRTEIATSSTLEGLEAKVKLLEDQAQWAAYGEAMKTAITEALENIEPGGNADKVISDITSLLAEHTFTVNVEGNYTGTNGAPGGNSTDNIPDSSSNRAGAAGGYVSYASGTRHIKPGVALTGEEGPELVWNKKGGYAYLVGKNGPEFADLVPGDLVFPADETKDIIRRGVTPSLAKGGKVVPAYEGGKGRWKDDGSNDNKGNSGKKKKEKTEGLSLDLDKYYNMVEDINELLRIRNLLEKDYELLLKNEGKTGKEIYDNLTRQLDLLEERRKITEDLAEKRKQQILDLVKENELYSNFAWWNDEDLTIEIDWDAVQEIEDKDTASVVKDYLSKLEDFLGKYDDMIEQLEEIESQVQEIKKRGKDSYDTLEERVRDALIKQIQDKIDELTEVNEAINETNLKLFDSMQETLEKLRQQRENKKTEEDLTDKEKRLAYLQLDSSNANALEIAKLQEELADARQDYTDNLIDLKISELQKLNDEAQEQRQELIDLMLRSLDWQEKSGAFWETVYKYISEGTDEIGTLVHGSELENLLKSAEPWDKLSEELRKSWVNELLDLVAQGIAYLELTRLLEDIGTKKGTEVTFTTAGEKLKGELNENGLVELEDSSGKKFTGEDIGGGNVRFTDEDGNLVGYGKVDKDGKVEFLTAGLTLTGTVDKDGNVVVTNPDGSTVTYKDVFLDYNGAYRTFETEGEAKKKKEDHTNTTGGSTGGDTGGSTGNDGNSDSDSGSDGKYYHNGDIYKHIAGSSPSHHLKYQLWYLYDKGQKILSSEKLVAEGGPSSCSFTKYNRSNEAYERWEYICSKCGYSYTTEQKRFPDSPNSSTNNNSGGNGSSSGGCFVAGTLILMADKSWKKIEDIIIGEEVIAYNDENKNFESRKVTKSYIHHNTPRVINIKLSNKIVLGITPGHPILTVNGWKSRDIENSLYEHNVVATWLNIGDIVISYFGKAEVLEITEQNISNNFNTYNIEVETCHTYLADGIVVHNAKVDTYKTGGLADYTGPAWLDGTKSHPELVLNARDTQNFIELKDTLAEIRKAGALSLNGGDNYYDIKVQVDSLGSDYDVDRAIDRIKARIAQDGAYRNVNTLSRLR